MNQLVIPDVESALLQRLCERAAQHGRTVETEAKSILADAIRADTADPWAAVDQIRDRLAATGREFSDSAESLTEDRQR